MQVFHFLNELNGLQSIKNRKLKISKLDDLNDPFEFFAIKLSDKKLRKAFKKAKSKLAKTSGLICFSKSWNSPLLWGHYADKHKGLCLGFDVPDKMLVNVDYIDERLAIMPNDINLENVQRFICTKYIDWSYEDEARAFLSLDTKCKETGLFFKAFSSELRLEQIIVGCESKVTRSQLDEALGNEYKNIETIKSRAAFKDFKIVKNNNQDLWK